MTPSNSLDQYIDQGSWTPIIAGSTAAGVGTYTVQAGTYTRIGNLVFLSGTVTWTAHTGTGNMLIQTLPFTSRNLANYHYDVTVNLSNIVLPAGTVQIMGEIQGSSTQIILEGTRTNNTNLPVSMDNTGTADISGFYLV
jgi:hypothetical protein